ncbi:hypothetical protein [Thermomonospora cellulosilytica]|uniref:Uncharacterized protein n=1 Tax=Thermomonospora cellulosilytica TaxID=1411118 RepID=A0A7W3MX16_9ACTN|nr:hypothetical protein [Thermomonospora cellulosilytica]MBA9003468.1 hypothetical protein [Thermomonospora cellulosilytica]
MNAPKVRVVKVRLSGEGDDAGSVAELLSRLLPELSEGRCQVGEISPAYPNRRGGGARRYFDLYLIEPGPGADATQPGRPSIPQP